MLLLKLHDPNSSRGYSCEVRSAAGLTQADLAARIGIRKGCVSALERGERVPTVSTLARVAEAAGKRLADRSLESREIFQLR